MTVKKTYIDESFDFGFSIVTEEELAVVQQAQEKLITTETTVTDTKAKLDKIYNAIQPLLNNLKKNPEKNYILWPNRIKKIEEFQDHLDSIYLGE
jgi:hypothetical protein